VTRTWRISYAAELEALGVFRDFIGRIGDEAGLQPELRDDLKLAVDEACTNIITHGYAGMDPGSIILDVQLAPAAIQVRITDFGHAFEPSQAPAPDINAPLDERAPGGFGLFFIYSVMDEVEYLADGVSNCLTLTKRLVS
jgi:serine/threonine-protein kinase RsbW